MIPCGDEDRLAADRRGRFLRDLARRGFIPEKPKRHVHAGVVARDPRRRGLQGGRVGHQLKIALDLGRAAVVHGRAGKPDHREHGKGERACDIA
jgi:hypothetical protein